MPPAAGRCQRRSPRVDDAPAAEHDRGARTVERAAPVATIAEAAWRPNSMTISRELLDKLACPKCRSPLEVMERGLSLACSGCDLAYAVHDGIPDLIVSDARPKGSR